MHSLGAPVAATGESHGNVPQLPKKQNPAKPFFDLLTGSPAKEKTNGQIPRNKGRQPRPQVDKTTFQAPARGQMLGSGDSSDKAWTVGVKVDEASQRSSFLAMAAGEVKSNQEQILKHQTGQFDWVLSIPVAGQTNGTEARSASQLDSHESRRDRKLYFGCNFVQRRTQSGGKPHAKDDPDLYTLIATQLEEDEDSSVETVIHDRGDRAPASEMTHARRGIGSLDSAICMADNGSEMTWHHDEKVRPNFESVRNGKEGSIAQVAGAEQGMCTSRRRTSSLIEDSLEAIDQLQDEIEAVQMEAHLDEIVSPDRAEIGDEEIGVTAKIANLNLSSSKPMGTSTVRAKAPQGGRTVRRWGSTNGSVEEKAQKSEKPTATSAQKKSAVPRPSSLLPAKPLAKSSRPPTLPTFELPGEAVARRLKAEREARRLQTTAEQAAIAVSSPSRPHVKSNKPATKSNFELPGEAISRRKREEREAKLKAEAEEARKRREFRARPVPNRLSIAAGTVPRETIASRARQSKLFTSGDGMSDANMASSPAAAPKKRHSLAVFSATASGGHGSLRSRHDPTSSLSETRPTSSGASSVGKRSQVSVEEVQKQKLRGRDIAARDNSAMTERDRERREREDAAKRARQEAAELSREKSRQWAEKRARERASTMGST